VKADPIGRPGGVNLYAYVGNDPVNFTDPWGLRQVHSQVGCYTTYRQDWTTRTEEGETRSGTHYWTERSPGCTDDYGFDLPTDDFPAIDADGGGDSDEENREERASTLERLGQCAFEQSGLGTLGGALAAASGANVLPTRGKFHGATPNTSVASRASRSVFGDTRLPVRLPTLTGFPGVGAGINIRATARLASIVGRGVPVVGWAILAYDAASIVACRISDE
jgi:hypothetical protein